MRGRKGSSLEEKTKRKKKTMTHKKARTKKDIRNDPRVEEFSKNGQWGGWVIVLKEGWVFTGEVQSHTAIDGTDGRGRNHANAGDCCDDLNNAVREGA
jgi:hypothetical protein